jgi:anaerobic selenocysteine-containing dehydrogenase
VAAQSTPAATVEQRTACSLDCFDACGVLARIEGDRIVGLRGDPEHPFTRGALCKKVNRYLETRQYSPERVTHPLRRTSSGWRRVSWPEALDEAATRLQEARARFGSLSVLWHRGNGSYGALNWVLLPRFFNLFGGATEAVGRFCGGEGDLGTRQSFGDCRIHDPSDLADHSDLLVIWGRNPAVTNIHLMPVIKQVRARGGLAVLIDPVRTKTAGYVDHAVHPRPGTDAWLAVGLARILLDEGMVDLTRLRDLAGGVEEYLAAVRATSVADVAARTGVDAATMRWLADLLVTRRPASILQGIGLQQFERGAEMFRFIAALGVLTGNVGVPGGGVNFVGLPWSRVRTPGITAADARTVPERTVPISRLGEVLPTVDDPPVRAALFMCGNPVNQMPDPQGFRSALDRLDLRICVDRFLTDTAEACDLFLPTTTMLEEYDYVPSYGHLWVQLQRPVVPPLGESKPDLEILQLLAQRLGFGEEMAGSGPEWVERVTEPFRGEGISYAALEAAGGRLWPAGLDPVPWRDGHFATPSGRFELPTSLSQPPGAPEAYPLFLVSQATDRSINSQLDEAGQAGDLPARIASTTAVRLGMSEGDRAWLVSERGRLPVQVVIDPDGREDVVVVPKGGWSRLDRNANVLTAPRFTDGTGCAFNQNFVRIEPDGG